MADFVIADSDILIDAGRGAGDAIACLLAIEQQSALAISVVTQMELMVGCQNKTELRNLEKFLARFRIIQLDKEISQTAVDLLSRYRLSYGLLIADALIAASAISQNVSFVSKNQRDYRFISELALLDYPHPFSTLP